MNKHRTLLSIVLILTLILVLLGGLAIFLDLQQSQNPPSVTTDPSTSSSTQATTGTPSTSTTVPPITTTLPPVTTTVPPTTSVPPTTAPTGLYTRAELEALSTKSSGYGPGRTSDGSRPPFAQSEQTKYAQYGGNFIGPDNGKIYLTFDCGYEYTATDENGNAYRVTERILNTLKEKDVKAVFFVTMDYVKRQPDLVQRMLDEGHVVGNHSNTHPVMPQLSIDQMEEEVMILHDYVKEHFGYEMFLFRPPTGEFSVQSLAVVHNLGYKNLHWSFAYGDYTPSNQPDVDEALALVTGSAHSGAIYLLHAVSVTNATILADAIDSFQAQGYELDLFR